MHEKAPALHFTAFLVSWQMLGVRLACVVTYAAALSLPGTIHDGAFAVRHQKLKPLDICHNHVHLPNLAPN